MESDIFIWNYLFSKKIIIWGIKILFVSASGSKMLPAMAASANASRPEVLCGSNFSANFFGKLLLPEVSRH